MKRIFLELDTKMGLPPAPVPTPCWIINDCGNDIKSTWEEIISADEIYFSSTFLTNGKSVLSSAEMFDVIMARAAKEGVKGKLVYCCSNIDDLKLSRIDSKLFNACFLKDNKFFAINKTGWTQILTL